MPIDPRTPIGGIRTYEGQDYVACRPENPGTCDGCIFFERHQATRRPGVNSPFLCPSDCVDDRHRYNAVGYWRIYRPYIDEQGPRPKRQVTRGLALPLPK